MAQTWSVVKFPDENSVEVVPTAWLNKEFCYWPSTYSDSKLKEAITKLETPQPDWVKYPYCDLRRNVFDTFVKATARATKAQYCSDLGSNSESELTQTHKKRTIIRRVISSSFEEDFEDEDITNLPKPPQLPKSVKKKDSRSDGTDIQTFSQTMQEDAMAKDFTTFTICDDEPVTLHEDTSQKGDNIKKGKKKGSRVCSVNEEQRSSQQTMQEDLMANNSTILPICQPVTVHEKTITKCSTNQDNSAVPLYAKEMIRNQNILKGMMSDMLRRMDALEDKIKAPIATYTDYTENSIFQKLVLPVNSDNDLEALENFLKEEEGMKEAINELAAFGGNNLYIDPQKRF